MSADPTPQLDPAGARAALRDGARAARRGASLGQLGHRARRAPGRSTSPTASPASRSQSCADAARIADIGSGAGFPGLALAAALPASQVDLIESVGRKCEFIRRAIEEAGIGNARSQTPAPRSWPRGRGPRGLRRRHRARGRPPLHPGRARLAAAREDGVLVAWKGSATPRRRRSWRAPPTVLAMRPERDPRTSAPTPAAAHRHLHVLRKTGPTPRRSAAPCRAWPRSGRAADA